MNLFDCLKYFAAREVFKRGPSNLTVRKYHLHTQGKARNISLSDWFREKFGEDWYGYSKRAKSEGLRDQAFRYRDTYAKRRSGMVTGMGEDQGA